MWNVSCDDTESIRLQKTLKVLFGDIFHHNSDRRAGTHAIDMQNVWMFKQTHNVDLAEQVLKDLEVVTLLQDLNRHLHRRAFTGLL